VIPEIKSLVIDTSIPIKWFLKGPYEEQALKLRDDFRKGLCRLFTPDVIYSEFANTSKSFHLAIQHKCPVYDCLFLALSTQKECHLITADEKFHRALRSSFSNLVWIGDYGI